MSKRKKPYRKMCLELEPKLKAIKYGQSVVVVRGTVRDHMRYGGPSPTSAEAWEDAYEFLTSKLKETDRTGTQRSPFAPGS